MHLHVLFKIDSNLCSASLDFKIMCEEFMSYIDGIFGHKDVTAAHLMMFSIKKLLGHGMKKKLETIPGPSSFSVHCSVFSSPIHKKFLVIARFHGEKKLIKANGAGNNSAYCIIQQSFRNDVNTHFTLALRQLWTYRYNS